MSSVVPYNPHAENENIVKSDKGKSEKGKPDKGKSDKGKSTGVQKLKPKGKNPITENATKVSMVEEGLKGLQDQAAQSQEQGQEVALSQGGPPNPKQGAAQNQREDAAQEQGTAPSQQQEGATPSQQQGTAPSQQQEVAAPSQQQEGAAPSQQQEGAAPSQQQEQWAAPNQEQEPDVEMEEAPASENQFVSIGSVKICIRPLDESVEEYPNIDQVIISHDSSRRYVVLYGDCKINPFDCNPSIFSIRIANAPRPDLIWAYEGGEKMNIVDSNNRIVEKIIEKHKNRSLPMAILSRVVILGAIWTSKTRLGEGAETDVLHPGARSRETVRCLVYLDPKYYKDYTEITNKSGVSWETRTTILRCLSAANQYEKKKIFYEKVCNLEHEWQIKFQSQISSVQSQQTSSTPAGISSTLVPPVKNSIYKTPAQKSLDPDIDAVRELKFVLEKLNEVDRKKILSHLQMVKK